MAQIIKKEWQITKMYIYEVVLQEGIINLDWNDFRSFAEEHRPLIAVKNEGDAPVSQLVDKAMGEARKQGISQPSSIIVSIFYKEGEEIMMEELFGLCDGMNQIASEDVAIKWGISQNDSLENKRSVNVFIFG